MNPSTAIAHRRYLSGKYRQPLSLCAAATGLLLLVLLTCNPAHAARSTKSSATDTSVPDNKAKRQKRNPGLKIQHSQNHSEETPAQRDKRLYRECRGLPNSGACAGYAHGPSR